MNYHFGYSPFCGLSFYENVFPPLGDKNLFQKNDEKLLGIHI